MAVWWRFLLPLFCFLLSCVYPHCAYPSGQQRTTYQNSLRLTRFIRTRVQQLLRRYKEQQLGDRNFEDRSLALSTLPILSTDFHRWLQLKDWERLTEASRNLHTYWVHLDRKRVQLEIDNGQKARTGIIPTCMESIQLDIKDLVRQVNSQLRHVSISSVSTTNTTNSPPVLPDSGIPGSNSQSSSPTPPQLLWTSSLEGYIVLRDLDLYLTKLARDFLLLASKHKNSPQESTHRRV